MLGESVKPPRRLSDSGQMPTLMIDTVCGIPAFKVQVGPDETIRSLHAQRPAIHANLQLLTAAVSPVRG